MKEKINEIPGKIRVLRFYHNYNVHSYLKAGESDADDKVGHPIDEHGDGHGTRTWPLGEQLCGDHPRNGAWSDGEEDDKGQHGDHGQVAHPVDHFLNITKKFLHYVGSNMFSMLKGFCLLCARNTRFFRFTVKYSQFCFGKLLDNNCVLCLLAREFRIWSDR